MRYIWKQDSSDDLEYKQKQAGLHFKSLVLNPAILDSTKLNYVDYLKIDKENKIIYIEDNFISNIEITTSEDNCKENFHNYTVKINCPRLRNLFVYNMDNSNSVFRHMFGEKVAEIKMIEIHTTYFDFQFTWSKSFLLKRRNRKNKFEKNIYGVVYNYLNYKVPVIDTIKIFRNKKLFFQKLLKRILNF